MHNKKSPASEKSEQVKKLVAYSTLEELTATAKELDIALDNELNESNQFNEDALDKVSGGRIGRGGPPVFKCPKCSSSNYIIFREYLSCRSCGNQF